MERGSSGVGCQETEGDRVQIPLCYLFEVWAFSFSPRCPSSLSCINAYLAIDSGGNVSEYSSRVITARLECLVDISCAVTIAAGAERHATQTIPAINYF